MSKNTFEKRCEELGNFVDSLSDSEKKFVLWLLLDYYRDGLLEDIKFEVKDKADYIIQTVMRKHIDACEEMRNVIREEIF